MAQQYSGWGPADIITGKYAVMKGYSEQRGVQSRVTFDAATGCFAHTVLVHDFHARLNANPDRPPDAEVIELPVRKSKATSLSRKSRDAVTQILKMQSVG